MQTTKLAVLLYLFAPPLAILATASDWTQFRGPGGSGNSRDRQLPAHWTFGDNVIWRTRLPGLGGSSPITLGNRVFVTCYTGYGLEPNQGDMDNLRRWVVCLDRSTGTVQWKKEFTPELPESTYSGGNSSRHGYSSSTPTTDGKHLYLFFGRSGVFCLDLQGRQIWHADVGAQSHRWGSSNSPVLYEDLLIINASVESQSLIALNKHTGQQVWQADGIRASWNTPLLVKTANGPFELVVSIQGSVIGFAPASGEKLWQCDGIRTYACPSAIAVDDVVYVTGGRGQQSTLAVRSGGRGNVTPTHILWRVEKGSNVSSLVHHNGYLYCANDSRGIAFCFDAATGDIKYEERLTPRPDLVYASPVVADQKIFYVSQTRGTYVVAAKPSYKLLAHNTFAKDTSRANASPVISNSQLLLRNDQFLYCLGTR